MDERGRAHRPRFACPVRLVLNRCRRPLNHAVAFRPTAAGATQIVRLHVRAPFASAGDPATGGPLDGQIACAAVRWVLGTRLSRTPRCQGRSKGREEDVSGWSVGRGGQAGARVWARDRRSIRQDCRRWKDRVRGWGRFRRQLLFVYSLRSIMTCFPDLV